MATPLSCEVISKTSVLKHLLTPFIFSRQCTRTVSPNLCNFIGRAALTRAFTKGTPFTNAAFEFSGFCMVKSTQTVFTLNKVSWQLQPALTCCLVPSRNYGHKRRQNPPKVTYFEYSGDLRTLPELNKKQPLYVYRDMQTDTEGNEILEKLTSLEFASAAECAEHRKQLVKDRIISLFGPDCEIELQIALITLSIRTLLPHCLKYRSDKLHKTKLVQRIHCRRRMLDGLRELDNERFEWLLKELKIRYVIPKDREQYKGWKHNLRVGTQEEVKNKQKKKLEELKAKFDAEKQSFFESKAKIMAAIEEDLKKFGLSWDFLDQVLEEEQKTSAHQHDQSKTMTRPQHKQ